MTAEVGDQPRISDAEYQTFLQHVGDILSEVADVVATSLPDSQHGVTWEKQAVAGLYMRTLDLYEACRTLITNAHIEAAMIVARSFLMECLLLRYLGHHPSNLKANIIRWHRTSLSQERGLAAEGAAIGVEGFDADDDDRELRALEALAADIPGSRGKLPSEKDMAKSVGDEEAYWTIKLCSNVVHTSRIAVGRLMQRRGDWMVAEPYVSLINLGWLTAVVTAGLFRGHEAAALLLGWQLPPGWKAAKHDVDARIGRLQRDALTLHGLEP